MLSYPLSIDTRTPPDTTQAGLSPLHHAAAGRSAAHAACAALLLSCGADAGARDPAGTQPLHVAASAGALPCLRALLAAGADADARSEARPPLLRRRSGAMEGSSPAHLCLLSKRY